MDERAARITPRHPCEGIAETIRSMPVERGLEGIGHAHGIGKRHARQVDRHWPADGAMSSASAPSRAHKRTSRSACPRWTANALPQLPAPSTAMFLLIVMPGAQSAAPYAHEGARDSSGGERRSALRRPPTTRRPSSSCRSRTQTAAAPPTRGWSRTTHTWSSRRSAQISPVRTPSRSARAAGRRRRQSPRPCRRETAATRETRDR